MDTFYDVIKKQSKEEGVSVKELLAMSPNNSPLYVGTDTDFVMAQWFRDIWDMAGYTPEDEPHLRQIHYWCVSQEVDTYNGLTHTMAYHTKTLKNAGAT